MRNLIIENNLPDFVLKKGLQLSISLDNPQTIISEDYNFEIFLFESLREPLISEQYDAIVVSLNLDSNNSLNLNGLDAAYTLRLSPRLNHQFIPIIILGSLSLEVVLRLNSKAKILLTPGVYYKNLSTEADEFINNKNFRNINKDEYDEFIERIEIKPPSNYQSHHSIANEWALARYFSMFEKDDKNELYLNLQNKIHNLDYLKTLHFKHLEAKVSRQKFNPKKDSINPIIKGIDGKMIGIIDDDISKGWLEFYGYIFNKSKATAIPYNSFQKDEKKDEMLRKIKEWILESLNSDNPIDFFIVDLRLHDDDFIESDFDKISGIQIIKFIKCNNPGVQVVVSTASNKVWNYQKCLKAGVKYFSIKESPETFSTRNETIASFLNFSDQVSEAVKDTFLAYIFRKIDDLKKENIFICLSGEKDKEFANLTFGKNGLLDQIFNLLVSDNTNDSLLNQCLLLAFQVLENYCNLSSVGDFGNDKGGLSSGYVWLKDFSKLQVFITQQTQISTRLELIYGNIEYQNNPSDTTLTPTSFNTFKSLELKTRFNSGLDATSLIKMISVLHFRDNINKSEIEKIIKYRYYRSNVAAHFTGKVRSNYKINSNDIVFFINVFTKLFK